ncbi:MAG: UDP-N-acetylglucosamine pyrophosphorylase [Fastidiosipilaceae bacterium]|jgi:NDP-sugar pyrophosphorylase family protein
MDENLKTTELFDLSHTLAKEYLSEFEMPWDAIPGIADCIKAIGRTLSPDEFDHPAEDVWISKQATVFESAYITGPCIILAGTEVRHCAFIRGSALVGENCVVGNSTELKNVILFNNVQVPHFNYVGDSILGYRSHMGAGSITSNVKADQSEICVNGECPKIETGLKKMGAIIGDGVEIGSNSVLNPGTIIGKNSTIYPLSMVRGTVPKNVIYKTNGETVKRL